MSMRCAAPTMQLPFAVGWKTEWVSRLLAATMIVEAFNCWGFWGEHPSWQYAVRPSTTSPSIPWCSACADLDGVCHVVSTFTEVVVLKHACPCRPMCGRTSSQTWGWRAGCFCCRPLGQGGTQSMPC